MLRIGLRMGRKFAATVASVSLLLSGCAVTQTQRIGSDDGTDACRAYVVALDSTGNYFAEDMVGGALAGAAAGALIGILASGGKDAAKAALIGAAAGAAAGAAGGYIKAKMDQEKDKQVLYNNVMSDYDRELGKIDEADLAFKKLVDCRNRTLQQVSSDYKGKVITRDEAKLRWKHILDQKANDLKIAEAMGKHMTERVGEFEAASTKISESPWDDKAEARFQAEQAQLKATQAQEAAALQKSYQEQQAALAKQKLQKAERAKAQKELQAKLAEDKAAQDSKHQEELTRIAQKKAGKIPTSTAQTHVQSYNANVTTASKDYKSQVATADNPDGFDGALSGKSSMLPDAVIRLGRLDDVGQMRSRAL